ncbi:hypothetical protein [Komagataeibacter saccharivorans]|uniref:hypothetical protein n=1 Tax=Komagataeibacter saccharivorans TaxID=265959 RepID=UPI000C8363BF|nr:hypothetical protein [Komagataeibacter saccharivorans]
MVGGGRGKGVIWLVESVRRRPFDSPPVAGSDELRLCAVWGGEPCWLVPRARWWGTVRGTGRFRMALRRLVPGGNGGLLRDVVLASPSS